MIENKLNLSYLYQKLSALFNKLIKLKKIDRKSRLSRIWSNQELRRLAPSFRGSIVNVSGSNDEDKEGNFYRDYFQHKSSYTITNFTGDRGYSSRDNEILLDITDNLPKELKHNFNVVFNHTMLEHVFDVFTAFRNLCDLSKDIVIIVVPFAQIQHSIGKSYGDYWRFTPTVIRELFRKNGFEVIYESESPYENAAVYLFFIASRDPTRWLNVFPKYKPIKRAGSWIGNKSRIRFF